MTTTKVTKVMKDTKVSKNYFSKLRALRVFRGESRFALKLEGAIVY